MTNFIKLKIEKEIKNNAGELQGLEWVEVYVNADNISHFKKVENTLCPNNNVKEIRFASPKYKDSTYYSRLEKYLLKSKTQDAFLKKDEFSDFIQKYGSADVSAIFAGDIMFSEAIEVYFKAGVHPLDSSDKEPVISCCGLEELKILVPKVELKSI